VVPAEVKTGAAADVASRATRRQLVEYALAYHSPEVLLVDADAGTVATVGIPAGASRPARRLGAVLCALLVGAAVGFAAGLAVRLR
jgi:hypothetical protein